MVCQNVFGPSEIRNAIWWIDILRVDWAQTFLNTALSGEKNEKCFNMGEVFFFFQPPLVASSPQNTKQRFFFSLFYHFPTLLEYQLPTGPASCPVSRHCYGACRGRFKLLKKKNEQHGLPFSQINLEAWEQFKSFHFTTPEGTYRTYISPQYSSWR